MTKVIPEAEVTTEAVEALFQRAFFKARIDEDGDVYVTDGLDIPVWATVDHHRKVIRLFTFASRDTEEYPPYTPEAANHLNQSVVLPTFYVERRESDRLYAHYFLSYEDGLIDSQFIALTRCFAGAVVYGAQRLTEHVLH
jgi:hypothetical protein